MNFLRLPDKYYSSDEVHRQRYLVFQIITLIGIIVSLATSYQYYFLLNEKKIIPTYSLILSVFLFLNYIALQWHKQRVISYLLAILSAFFIIHITTYYTGGILNSGLYYLSVIILATFFLLGNIWGTVSLLISIADINYFQFIDPDKIDNLIPINKLELDSYVTLLFCFIVIALLSFGLEWTKNHAIKEAADASKLLQKSLVEVEKFSTVLSQTDNSVMITDKLGRIEWVNEGFVKLTGYTLDEVKDSYGEILRRGEKTGLSDSNVYKVCIEQKKTISYVEKNYSKSGNEYWVATTLTPVFNEKGKLQNLIAIDTNMTERKQMEEDLIKAINIAEESVNNQRELMNVVSKEIRVPLLNMIQLTEELMNSELIEKQQVLVQTLRMSAKTLDLTLNDVLAYAKIKTREELLKLSRFSFSEFLTNISKSYENQARNKKLSFSYFSWIAEDEIVEADKGVLEQLFNNFFNTALNFTDSGKIEMTIEKGKLIKGQTSLKIRFRHVGTGISPQKRVELLNHFDQKSEIISGYKPIGIDISTKIIHAIGGTLGIETQNDNTFELWFSFKVKFIS